MASNNIAIGVASGNEASVEEHTYSTADSSPSKPYGGKHLESIKMTSFNYRTT